MLLGTLGASLLGSLLGGKDVDGVIQTGKGTIIGGATATDQRR